MPKIKYKHIDFRVEKRRTISRANQIIEKYAELGYTMTVRQLYYQLVTSGFIQNNQKSYKALVALINDARLAGLVDWEAIVDRTRRLMALQHMSTLEEVLGDSKEKIKFDLWKRQPKRVEVWVEKEALFDVMNNAAIAVDIPFLCCRGYTSQSIMWRTAQRMMHYMNAGKDIIILHLGDHDPSGKDMTRDLDERLSLFLGEDFHVERIALNLDQITSRKLPPNPTKFSDSRSERYVDEFGDASWELDALAPDEIHQIVVDAVTPYIDQMIWAEDKASEAYQKQRFATLLNKWSVVSKFVEQRMP